jgi:heat shock protein HtpX
MKEPSSPLNQYTTSSADWRGQIRLNQRRTRFVIATYLLIYLLFGLLLDMAFVSVQYVNPPLTQIFWALVTFQLIPYTTIITTAIAIISLLITFKMHDKLIMHGTNYRLIDSFCPPNSKEMQLYNVVEEMKVAAGLSYMPKVYLIDAPYMNAFASGYSEKSAMVAITSGLLEKLDRDELQAVMAHELSHIRHMDIKLTLMASVLSNIMLIMVDWLFYRMMFRTAGNRNTNVLVLVVVILRLILPFLTVFIMLYLSRTREYMADAGSVQLTRTNEPMARALLKIQGDYEQNKSNYSRLFEKTQGESVRRQAYIFDPVQAGLKPAHAANDLFSTHPSVEKRLAALGFKKHG